MTNVLVAFALVAEEYEKFGDPVRGLAPLLQPILRERAGSRFEPDWFAEKFTAAYGMSMTPFVARAIAENLASSGLLKRSDTARDQFEIPMSDSQAYEASGVAEEQILETVGYFERWASRELARLKIDSAGVDYEEVLLGRLAHPEFASVFLEKGQPRDSARIRRLLGKGDFEPERSLDQLFDFLVARFLLAAYETAPEVFDQLAAIAFGALIADAVAGIASPGVVSMPDPPLRVVIDGPLLLDALDLNTPAYLEYSTELLAMMSQAGFRLVTFDHVVDEVRESIQSTLRAHAGGVAYGPLGERLRSKPGFSARASSILDTLTGRLAELGVDVLRSDIYERADFKKYFSDEAVDRVRNAIGDVHHQLERRIRDTKSVAAVVRLKRENRRPSSVFEAGTIFLTRNSALAKQANRALAVGKSEPDPRFAVVTDGQLASTLWFSLGAVNDFSSFSKKRLIANCSAAMVPQKDVIQRIAAMLEDVDEQLKAEFEVLMRDKRASLCAMRMTGGYADVVDQDFSRQVLEEMRKELVAPIVEPLMEQLSEERSSLARLQAEVNATKDANVTLQETVSETQNSYDMQLAQVSILLQGERATKTRIRTDIESAIGEADAEVSSVSRQLERRKSNLRSVVVGLWITVSVIALLLSVFPEIISGYRSRAIVFLVLVSTLGFFKDSMDRAVDKAIGWFSQSLTERLRVAQTQKDRLTGLLTQVGVAE